MRMVTPAPWAVACNNKTEKKNRYDECSVSKMGFVLLEKTFFVLTKNKKSIKQKSEDVGDQKQNTTMGTLCVKLIQNGVWERDVRS